MTYLIFLVPAWGHIHGGINSLNHDLVCAIGDASAQKNLGVLCISSAPVTSDNENQAADHNIILKSVGGDGLAYPTDQWIAIKEILNGLADLTDSYCVGHDVFTGHNAIRLHELTGTLGRSIFVHHMDYESYINMKVDPDVLQNNLKFISQEGNIQQANLVIAIGPKLFSSAKTKRGNSIDVYQLNPGLSHCTVSDLPGKFRAITFGRYDRRNDALKQMLLAAKAFVAHNLEIEGGYDDSTLNVIGTSQSEEALEFKTKAIEGTVSGYNNIVVREYESNREALITLLSGHSVCLMLSVHEGFGLVGLEAISAGVPLILSINTGLYQFLESIIGDAAFEDFGVVSVSVAGSDSEETNEQDIASVKKAFDTVRNNSAHFKSGILRLRDKLLDGYTWKNSANEFLKIVELDQQAILNGPEHDARQELIAVVAKLNRQGKNQPVLDNGFYGAPDPFAFRSRSWLLSGRQNELQDLIEFAESREFFEWWSLNGPAGSGKSRVALELAIKLIENGGWNAGFLEPTTTFDFQNWVPALDTLIVIDEAHMHAAEIQRILRLCSQKTSLDDKQIRILVVERAFVDNSWQSISNSISAGTIRSPFKSAPLQIGPLSKSGLIELIQNFKADTDKLQTKSVIEIEHLLTGNDHHNLPLYALMGMTNIAQNDTIEGSDVVKTSLDLDKERVWNMSRLSLQEIITHKRLVAFINIVGKIDAGNLIQIIGDEPALFPTNVNADLLQQLGMYNLGEVYPRQPIDLGIYFVRLEFVAPTNVLQKISGLDKILNLAWRINPQSTKAFLKEYVQRFPGDDIQALISPLSLGNAFESKDDLFGIFEAKIINMVSGEGLESPELADSLQYAYQLISESESYNSFKVRLLCGMLETAARNDHDTLAGEYSAELSELGESELWENGLALDCCYTFFRLGKHYSGLRERTKFDHFRSSMRRMHAVHRNAGTLELTMKLENQARILDYSAREFERAEAFTIKHPISSAQDPVCHPDESNMRNILLEMALFENDPQKVFFNFERVRFLFEQDSTVENQWKFFLAMENMVRFSLINNSSPVNILEDYHKLALSIASPEAIEEWTASQERLLKPVFFRDRSVAELILVKVEGLLKRHDLTECTANLIWMTFKKGIEFHLANFDTEAALSLYDRMLALEAENPTVVDEVTQCGTALLFRNYYESLGDKDKSKEFYEKAKQVIDEDDIQFKLLDTLEDLSLL